jgi:hypothetical protein
METDGSAERDKGGKGGRVHTMGCRAKVASSGKMERLVDVKEGHEGRMQDKVKERKQNTPA